jgi:hypothetical protein
VIELTDSTSVHSAFWGLYSCTVFLSGMFLLRECLELLAMGPRIYFSSGIPHNTMEIMLFRPKYAEVCCVARDAAIYYKS